MSAWRLLRPAWLVLALGAGLFLGAIPVRAQSLITTHLLDPDDAITYREWAKKEFDIDKADVAAIAARAAGHATWHHSEMAPIAHTAVPGDAPGSFWEFQVPAWAKRFAVNPFTPQPGAGNGETISKLFQGLTTYQKARATLRTIALVKASIAGMRFEVNVWKLMKNIDVSNYEEYVLPDSGDGSASGGVARMPLGVVSFGIVPRGKENWRAVVAYLHDDPLWDTGAASRIKYKGPHKLSDISLEAQETVLTTGSDDNSALEDWLEIADRNTRAVGEGLATLRSTVNKRVGQAYSDAQSPRRLWNKLHAMQKRQEVALNSMIVLRAQMEARSPADVAKEYAGTLVDFANDAKKAYATAEASANFYQQMSAQADNVMVEFQSPERQSEIKKLEEQFAAWVNEKNDRVLSDDINEFAQWIGSNVPEYMPFLNGPALVADFGLMVAGNDNASSNDDKDFGDLAAFMEDAKAKIFGLRFGYYLWQELRATRKLLWMIEKERAAAKGLENDPADSESYMRVFDAAVEHEILKSQLQNAVGGLNRWKNGQKVYPLPPTGVGQVLPSYP